MAGSQAAITAQKLSTSQFPNRLQGPILSNGSKRWRLDSMRTLRTAFTLLVSLLALSQLGQADDNADELQRLEGRYERTFANTAGTQFKVIKEVVGDQSV